MKWLARIALPVNVMIAVFLPPLAICWLWRIEGDLITVLRVYGPFVAASVALFAAGFAGTAAWANLINARNIADETQKARALVRSREFANFAGALSTEMSFLVELCSVALSEELSRCSESAFRQEGIRDYHPPILSAHLGVVYRQNCARVGELGGDLPMAITRLYNQTFQLVASFENQPPLTFSSDVECNRAGHFFRQCSVLTNAVREGAKAVIPRIDEVAAASLTANKEKPRR
jgi:hypothetical protein